MTSKKITTSVAGFKRFLRINKWSEQKKLRSGFLDCGHLDRDVMAA